MKILGLSCFFHDSAAAIVEDGKILAAAQEERFSRNKHDPSFPSLSIQSCLAKSNFKSEDIDAIVFYEKPFLKFERLLETYIAYAPKGFKSFSKAVPLWSSEKAFQKRLIAEHLIELGFPKNIAKKIYFSDHHLSHAASSFYCSPFAKSLVLVMDGVGEWATTSVFMGDSTQTDCLKMIKEIPFPHSLGLLYSAVTYHLGFKVNSGEYKVMGLAPYGRPIYADIIKQHFLHTFEDGSYWLDQQYFDYCAGLKMTNSKFGQVLGLPRREPESNLQQEHMDLAASIQVVLEDTVLNLLRALKSEFPTFKNLCMAGGVALNCVANGKILREKLFDDLFIQPAAGDAGGALGAALAYYYSQTPHSEAATKSLRGSYLGSEYTDENICAELKAHGAVFETLSKDKVIQQTALALSEGKAVGWFQGAMEFGPRALGNRSILGDPRNTEMQKNLNLKIKFRESFRPFAPAVLEEHISEWFEIDRPSPYMLLVSQVAKQHQIPVNEDQKKLFGLDLLNIPKSKIPAVTHVDHSARIQSVSKATNPKFHALISEFNKITGVPVLVNTSFNVRGEPIVCSPADAFKCFMGTDLDLLVVGNQMLSKKNQTQVRNQYHQEFSLD